MDMKERHGIWLRLVATAAIDSLYLILLGLIFYAVDAVALPFLDQGLHEPHRTILHIAIWAFEILVALGIGLFLFRDLCEMWLEGRRQWESLRSD